MIRVILCDNTRNI